LPTNSVVNTTRLAHVAKVRPRQVSRLSAHLQHIPVWMSGGCSVGHHGPPDEEPLPAPNDHPERDTSQSKDTRQRDRIMSNTTQLTKTPTTDPTKATRKRALVDISIFFLGRVLEVSFPMTGNCTVLDFGGTFTDHDHVTDLGLRRRRTGAVSWLARYVDTATTRDVERLCPG